MQPRHFHPAAKASGGSSGQPSLPMEPNSFIFTYIFAKKHPHQGLVPPTPPQWISPLPPPMGNPGSATESLQ